METGQEQQLTHDQTVILSALKPGLENRVSTEFLRDLTGLSERALRSAVRDLRLAGFVILSTTADHGGYYLSAEGEETTRFVELMEQRIDALKEATTSAKRSLKRKGAR